MDYISGDFCSLALRVCKNRGFCRWQAPQPDATDRRRQSDPCFFGTSQFAASSAGIDAGTDRMFRLPSQFALLLLLASGCMYQPMYQPGYGQPMYGPGGYAQPGTMVVPQSNAPPYNPGSTYDANPSDDFKSNDSSAKDGRFFSGDDDGGVPPARDPNASGSEPFNRDPLNNP